MRGPLRANLQKSDSDSWPDKEHQAAFPCSWLLAEAQVTDLRAWGGETANLYERRRGPSGEGAP